MGRNKLERSARKKGSSFPKKLTTSSEAKTTDIPKTCTPTKILNELRNCVISPQEFRAKLNSTNPSTSTAPDSDQENSIDDIKLRISRKRTVNSQAFLDTFISPKEFRPALKAGPRKNKPGMRKAGRSLIATDTPEKNSLAEMKSLATKKNKKEVKKTVEAVKKVKKDLFDERKDSKRRNKNPSTVESSDDEQEEFRASGLSSGGEDFGIETDSDDEEIVLRNENLKLHRSPRENDFVIILFKTKNNTVYYVAMISLYHT